MSTKKSSNLAAATVAALRLIGIGCV